MLARRLTTILPAMTLAEAIETTWMPRAAGRIGERTALVTRAPEGTAPLSPPPHRLPRIHYYPDPCPSPVAHVGHFR